MKLAFLDLPREERRLYFEEAGRQRNLSPILFEKDFWVRWLLGLLFRSKFAADLVFKGVTLLSKSVALSGGCRNILTWRFRPSS